MKIAIFDMDGTLLNSSKDITISVNEVRRKNHKLGELSEAFVIEAINRDKRNLAKLFYETEVYEPRDRLYFEEHYASQCIQNVHLYEGVQETLESLREHRVRMSVATNAPTQFARLMLDKCGIFENFDFVIGADRVKKAKPDREMLVHILRGYGYLRGNRALMIGDNSKDMQAAEHAGIDAGFATWGFSPESTHSKVFTQPQDIISYFKD